MWPLASYSAVTQADDSQFDGGESNQYMICWSIIDKFGAAWVLISIKVLATSFGRVNRRQSY